MRTGVAIQTSNYDWDNAEALSILVFILKAFSDRTALSGCWIKDENRHVWDALASKIL